jgi:hypothetical protein
MPSRVHYVYTGAGSPRFDSSARAHFQDQLRRKVIDTLPARAADRIMTRLAVLPQSFRKAIPILEEIATEQEFTMVKKLRKFRLPKRLRRAKNPIHSWKSL